MAKTEKTKLKIKADKLLQQLGRLKYAKDGCIIPDCKRPYACLHHYHTKSSADNLRYDWDNLIPICNGCHMQHHNGNPDIHNAINKIKGQEWIDKLERRKHEYEKHGIQYYRDMIIKLEKEINKWKD